MPRWNNDWDDDWYEDQGHGWGVYMSVEERCRHARYQVDLLARLGLRVQPVPPGGDRAASVWGQAWCRHLESFSDYANRLPRGRSYVRHGAVVHLELEPRRIQALVDGTHTYHVDIKISPLAASTWQAIRRRCSGQVGTMIELLEGRISGEVMAVMADREHGLFPQPREIKLKCSCPDWAVMCKHVAAVLYGVGQRLDTVPELLFELRGVDPRELVEGWVAGATATAGADEQEGTLLEEDLEGIFGVELDGGTATEEPVEAVESFAPSAGEVRRLRRTLNLSVTDFADRLGVTMGTVYRWERKRGKLRLRGRARAALRELMAEVGR